MSSLRVESVRLVWLEAYLEAADCQNFSEAARNLGIDQSTLSRYLQSLRDWLGRDLFFPFTAGDGADPSVTVSETADGRRFYARAKVMVRALHSFRTDTAKRKEAMTTISELAAKLEAERSRRNRLPVTVMHLAEIEHWLGLSAKVDEDAPIEVLTPVLLGLRSFFRRYEVQRNKELRIRKKRKAARKMAEALEPPPLLNPH